MSEVNNDVLRPVLVYSSIMPAAYIILLWWAGWVVGIYHLDHAVDSNCEDSGEILVPGVFLIVVDRFLHTW